MLPCLSKPVREDLGYYLVYLTPVFVLYLYFMFSLFPFKADRPFTQRPVLNRLLLSTFLGALPFILLCLKSDKPFLFWPVLMYWAVLLLIITPISWHFYKENKEKIASTLGMETALAQTSADLQFLRSQINPHFLFNALNTLYGTALKEKAEFTAEGIQKLGDMMRFMLHENNQDAIPMHKEMEYLRNYIDLQKLRTQTSPDILIEDNIEEAHCDRNIAPMLLIPFVENAFKHGISLQEKSWIDIQLECTEQAIRFEVRNSKHVRAGLDTENEKSGIGLKNVAARLQLLYPGRHELQITEGKTEFIVKLLLR